MATIWEEFGVAVKTARANKNLTGKQLAFIAFGSDKRKSYVSLIESGGTRLSARTVAKLAHALDLPDSVTAPVFRAHLPDEDKLDTDARSLMQMAAADTTTPGTADALMIALAYEFAQGSHIELQTAYTALRGALQTAQDMKDQIDRLHNMDDRLAAVLRRVAAMNDRGETDAAGQELDAAIKAKEAEIEALQDAALQQDRLRNDAASYAKRLVARLHTAAPPGGVFMATVHLLTETRERGERQGDPFDLAVALALARINHDRAKGRQVGQALLSLGSCCFAIAKRQPGIDQLNLALNACTAALDAMPRRSQPRGWAEAKIGIGNALHLLSDREGGAARLHDALAAFRSALQVYTRDAAPRDWARAQTGLGVVLCSLGEREGDTARLHDAVAAYRAALEVDTCDAAPMDWAGTQHNLAIAFLSLHTLDHATDWLDQAKTAFDNALTLRTRQAGEYLWADSHGGLGKVSLARFRVTGNRDDLARARTYLTEARAVYALDPDNVTLQDFDRLLAEIDPA